MQQFWEQRYDQPAHVYGKQPNAFFKAILDDHEPGKLLLPAEGEGRNAVYAARKGWIVDAFDFSANARKKALRLAEENGVMINYYVSSIEDFSFEANTYDMVGLCYVHAPPAIRTFLHRRVIESLKPEGQVVLEAFNKKQITLNSGGPKKEALLYDESIIKLDFADLSVVYLEALQEELSEGAYHKGLAEIIRFIGKKL